MEVDPPSPENSDQGGGGSISSDPHVRTQTQAVRFYDCSFCKRGFSNAQALGGHMNIHRRERAKLREPSSIINKKEKAGSSLVLDSSESKLCNQRQFQLFLERPPNSKKNKSRSDERETQMIVEGYKELDLELRLGPES